MRSLAGYPRDPLLRAIAEYLEQLAMSPGIGSSMRSLGFPIRFLLTSPDLAIRLEWPESAAALVSIGELAGPAPVELSMETAAAAQVFAGLVQPGALAATGELAVTGEPGELGALWPAIAFAGAPRFRDLAQRHGAEVVGL